MLQRKGEIVEQKHVDRELGRRSWKRRYRVSQTRSFEKTDQSFARFEKE